MPRPIEYQATAPDVSVMDRLRQAAHSPLGRFAVISLAASGFAIGLNADGGTHHNGQETHNITTRDSDGPQKVGRIVLGQKYRYCQGSVLGHNTCYYEVGAQQSNFTARGASVNISQSNPDIGPSDKQGLNHSIIEMIITSANSKQAIELGIYKDMTTPSSILFATAWVNGKFKGYAENGGTGYVPVGDGFQVGDKVKVGATGTYSVSFDRKSNEWEVMYGLENKARIIGDFAESVWSNHGTSFTDIQKVNVFGEVESGLNAETTTQMGNGVLGSGFGAAKVSGFDLIGSTVAAHFHGYSTTYSRFYPRLGSSKHEFTTNLPRSDYYDLGNYHPTSFTLGGPGYISRPPVRGPMP